MSEENLEVVERAIRAVNRRDVDGYLACCAEDVELRTPTAPVSGAYQGREGILRFFADIRDAGPDFQIELEQMEEIDSDRVLAFMHVNATGRASGIPTAVDMPTTNIYEFVDGKISRIRIFLDRKEALEAARVTE